MEDKFLHSLITFKKKPAKQGKDFMFWIPRTYITNGLIKPDRTYEIFLKEVPGKENDDKTGEEKDHEPVKKDGRG
jgi:hypothetical protein